jgi:hypothetical protein
VHARVTRVRIYPEPFISAPYGHELVLYQLYVSAVNENLESIGSRWIHSYLEHINEASEI